MKRTLEVVHVLVHVLERVIHVPTHHLPGVGGLDALRRLLYIVDEDGVLDAAAIQRMIQPVQVLWGDHDVDGGVHPQLTPKVEAKSVSDVV